ncbi:FAD-binding oxidoreductase [Ovoidimarina sediminis]|uniref:FAD-binding oxidoreductase n=1 Tax=Ovoidimarina sediminis TaxID=3079856 RepID=UPI00290804D0|nr:FAD-binding oxidoreductase [Rhodophyticola sp. MJ-SS7]MDU8942768.1 FAD-binding oxidoreductase [Rhodophyticola sp. MJ-SS7]
MTVLTPVTDDLRAALRETLPAEAFRDIAPGYLEEPRGRWQGRAGLVLAPGTVAEVSAILSAAAAAGTPVIPYGGGTGLVGGQVAEDLPDPIILSLERMNRIRAVYPEENVIIAEAGATLHEIQTAAAEAGRYFPLSYASEGTARIGGALSVNSGGLNVLRYGTARDLCLGIEAVLPDGQVIGGLKRLRKDNTGYDLKSLMIGSEGTLGVITAASLRLFPVPGARATALLAVPSPGAALSLLARAQAVTGGAVSAFELISGMGPAFLDEVGMGPAPGLSPFPDWAVLAEIATATAAGPEAMLEEVFAQGFEAGEITDGVLAASEAQRAELWQMREAIPEANRKVGAVASHDISLPLSRIPAFLTEAARRVAAVAPVRINAFGHLGDGNLHYNLFPPAGETRAAYDGVRGALSRVVHDLVAEMEGSFSAEHGLGRLKTGDLMRYGDPVNLALMRRIKTMMDPKGIMNPGAVLPIAERPGAGEENPAPGRT